MALISFIPQSLKERSSLEVSKYSGGLYSDGVVLALPQNADAGMVYLTKEEANTLGHALLEAVANSN